MLKTKRHRRPIPSRRRAQKSCSENALPPSTIDTFDLKRSMAQQDAVKRDQSNQNDQNGDHERN
jgi:hypothetical protein